jgi:hypothetical protein
MGELKILSYNIFTRTIVFGGKKLNKQRVPYCRQYKSIGYSLFFFLPVVGAAH